MPEPRPHVSPWQVLTPRPISSCPCHQRMMPAHRFLGAAAYVLACFAIILGINEYSGGFEVCSRPVLRVHLFDSPSARPHTQCIFPCTTCRPTRQSCAPWRRPCCVWLSSAPTCSWACTDPAAAAMAVREGGVCFTYLTDCALSLPPRLTSALSLRPAASTINDHPGLVEPLLEK